jgi:undecaprenyl-diphosphatase
MTGRKDFSLELNQLKSRVFLFLLFLAMFDSLEALDRELLLAINSYHSPWLDALMWFLSKTWPTYLLVFLVAIPVYHKYNFRKALKFLVSCAIVAACTDLSSNAIKHRVKRFRPTHNLEIREKVRIVNDYAGGKYGFFSGHAANTFGVTTFMFLCASWLSRKYMVLICLYPFMVSYSRMYLGVHYPSDILSGMIYGILLGWLLFILLENYFLKLNEERN